MQIQEPLNVCFIVAFFHSKRQREYRATQTQRSVLLSRPAFYPKVTHFNQQELTIAEAVRAYHFVSAFRELRISVTSPDPGLRMSAKEQKDN